MSTPLLALVVEDSEDQAELLRRHLGSAGYETVAVADAEAAIAALDKIEPTLAIIDLLLPGISGAECARRITERFPDCRLVISSVLDPADYPTADAVLPKPVRGAELRAMLQRIRG